MLLPRIAALLGSALLIGALLAYNLGVYDKLVIEPRQAAEVKKQQERYAYWAEIGRLDRQFNEELKGMDGPAVIARLGDPAEKMDRQFVSTGKNHPLWRYKSPPLTITFDDGIVDFVHYDPVDPPPN